MIGPEGARLGLTLLIDKEVIYTLGPHEIDTVYVIGRPLLS